MVIFAVVSNGIYPVGIENVKAVQSRAGSG